VLGLDNAGKTTILKRLTDEDTTTTTPTQVAGQLPVIGEALRGSSVGSALAGPRPRRAERAAAGGRLQSEEEAAEGLLCAW
jgi:GTPase SAR1 family protein